MDRHLCLSLFQNGSSNCVCGLKNAGDSVDWNPFSWIDKKKVRKNTCEEKNQDENKLEGKRNWVGEREKGDEMILRNIEVEKVQLGGKENERANQRD